MTDGGGDPACWAHLSSPTATEVGELLASPAVSASLAGADVPFLWDGEAFVLSGCIGTRSVSLVIEHAACRIAASGELTPVDDPEGTLAAEFEAKYGRSPAPVPSVLHRLVPTSFVAD